MDTNTSIHNSPDTTNFIKEKQIPVLRKIIADIKENTRHSMNVFTKTDKKFQGIPATLIPDSRDIRTGFENTEQIIAGGHYLLVDNTLFIPYITAGVGRRFSTHCFEKEAHPLPGRSFPGFAITLEKKWRDDQLSDEFKVEFMDGYGEHNIGDHMEFVLWFAPKLARKYMEWCIEREEAVNKCFAITKCLRNNSPYSTCLTSATIRKSAATAYSSSDHGCCTNKKRCTDGL